MKKKEIISKKSISINNPLLEAVYELHYWVRYNDCIEDNELWLVDEGRSVGLMSNIENDEVTIDVAHDAKDESWVQYEKGAASKIIKLSDCSDFIVEKVYLKRNERMVDKIVEKSSVTNGVFKNSIIINRRVNL